MLNSHLHDMMSMKRYIGQSINLFIRDIAYT